MSRTILKGLASGLSQRPTETYSPDILPLMQSLLRTLVDIDFEFQRDRETIFASAIEVPLRQRALATLRTRHHERRAPYVRDIRKLERQVQGHFA